MTNTKSPKARHSRLLSNGFFPPEMPACFYSRKLGVERDKLLADFQGVPAKGKAPAYQTFQSQTSTFNFPRLNREDRRHSYMNPISYFYLSKIIAEKYVALRKLNRRSKISLAPTIFDWSGERALIRPGFEARDSQRITLSANHALLAEADIAAFFHSVYTHVIPWAIHGKRVAKQKKRDMTLFGNELDLLVRNAQEGQTIGLPVGPDTSRVLAEVIGTAIDKAIQGALSTKRIWNSRKRGAMRFVDDFTFGCSSVQEAEIVISSVRRFVNEFELEINNSKTKISPTGPFFPAAWKEHVRGLLPEAGSGRSGLLRYFYGIESVVRDHPEFDVQKFVLQNSRRLFLETDDWRLVEDYLLSCYRHSPTAISVLTEIVILRHLDKKDVQLDRIAAFVAAQLPAPLQTRKFGEIYWWLYLCINLGVKISVAAVTELFEVDDGAIALLISDAKKLGLINGSIDQSQWDQSLTGDGLRSSMWLYSYESALKGLNASKSDSHVMSDVYFQPLFARKVEFYRSGSLHMSGSALLRRLRVERLRRQLQEEAIDEDLANDIIDFEDVDEDEDDHLDAYN
jgi:hypothetical protein